VRCARCRAVWYATPTLPDDPPAMPTAETDDFSLEPAAPRAALQDPATSFDDAQAEEQEASAAEAAPAAPFLPEQPSLPPFSPDLTTAEAGDFTVAYIPPTFVDPKELEEAPSIIPSAAPDPHVGHDMAFDDPVPDNIETVASRRSPAPARRRRFRLPRLPHLSVPLLPVATAALALVIAGLIAGRHSVVRAAPQTASFYAAIGMPVNLRGLSFKNIRTFREVQDGVPVLLVEGRIVAVSAKPVEVPRLRFALLDVKGAEIYAWTTVASRSVLGSGEEIPFRSRLAAPPPEGREVRVRFFGRFDTLPGTR
jgi:hypothetical protein